MMLDQLRFGMAGSFPGIDPRVWFAWAIVEAVKVDARGAKADVKMLPEGRPETVAIGGQVGKGYGVYEPIAVGQLVIVAFRDGNADAGGTIVGSIWDQGQAPPQRVIDNPDDAAVIAPEGRKLRVIAYGGDITLGQVSDLILESTNGTVRLGLEAAVARNAREGDTVQVTIPAGMIHVPNPPTFTPPSIPNPLPITLSGVITSGSDRVRSS